MKAVCSSRFQPGEGPSRGLLRDYEPSDGTFSSTRKEFDIQYSVAVSAESAKKARGLCSLEENNAEHSKY